MRQRSRRDDLAGCEWRIDLIARENIDEMTQCRNRSTQQIRSATVIKDRAVALQIDFEGRKRPAPILGMRCDGVTRPDKQGSNAAQRLRLCPARKTAIRERSIARFRNRAQPSRRPPATFSHRYQELARPQA